MFANSVIIQREYCKGQAGLARHHSDRPLHLTQVLLDVVLDQVLDEGGFAYPRRSMDHHYKGWGFFWGCVLNRTCINTAANVKTQ